GAAVEVSSLGFASKPSGPGGGSAEHRQFERLTLTNRKCKPVLYSVWPVLCVGFQSASTVSQTPAAALFPKMSRLLAQILPKLGEIRPAMVPRIVDDPGSFRRVGRCR